MNLTLGEFEYLAICLEGFFFGLYSGIFAMHLQYHASKEETDNVKQNIVFYALCVLYVLSAADIAVNIATFVVGVYNHDISMEYRTNIAGIPLFGCCDFIAQSILIHRCWIVWRCNIRVIIIPSILAFVFLALWIACIGAYVIIQGAIDETVWGVTLTLTGLTASMTVNALVTGLIVFRIYKVFREVKGITTSAEKSLGVTGGRKLRSIIFVIIESGMALFAIQLARLVITFDIYFASTAAASEFAVLKLFICIHEMLNGITPTIILVRVSMGLSFHDEPSLVDAVGSLQFAADDPNPIPGTGDISQDGSLCIGPDDINAIPEMVNISQERGDDDIGGGDDIQMVYR